LCDANEVSKGKKKGNESKNSEEKGMTGVERKIEVIH
jgi:hypothetical protein